MTPNESKAFLKVLALTGLAWLALGILLFRENPAATNAFVLCYQAVILDLAAIILLFWKLFFGRQDGVFAKFTIFLIFTFKLVCLGFLAITLKRLRNDPHFPAALAVSFMGIGPLLAGVAAKKWTGSKQG